jgi:hypothetical protein
MFWIMVVKGNEFVKPYFIKAEPPCNKGEVGFSILCFVITIGWQQYA